MRRRFYIYAGSYEQARELAHDLELQPTEWTSIHDLGTLAGLRNKIILFHGTWRTREDTESMLTMCKEREHKILYIN